MFKERELLRMTQLNVESTKTNEKIIKNINFKLNEAEIFVILGNKSSGKTSLVSAFFNLFDNKKIKIDGDLFLKNIHLNLLEKKTYNDLIDKEIGYVPNTYKNDFFKKRSWYDQLLNTLISKKLENPGKVLDNLLEKMKVKNIGVIKDIPFRKLSIENKRKITLGEMFLHKPSLLILDNIFIGLDLLGQYDLIEIIKMYKNETGGGILLTTTDSRIAAHLADRVGILYEGQLIEQNTTNEIFSEPINSQTKTLINIPRLRNYISSKEDNPSVLEIKNLRVNFRERFGFLLLQSEEFFAVDDISFNFNQNKIYGLIGTYKSGKIPFAKAISRRNKKISGQLTLNNKEYTKNNVQYISISSVKSLDKNKRIDELFEKDEDKDRLAELIKIENFDRKVNELDLNKKIGLVFALSVLKNPSFIIVDESSFLMDYSNQYKIWETIIKFHSQCNFGLIVISHEIDRLKSISDYLLVMDKTRFVEVGRTEKIINNAKHPHTKLLLASVLQTQPSIRDIHTVVRKDIESEYNREYDKHYDYENRPYDLKKIDEGHFISIDLDLT